MTLLGHKSVRDEEKKLVALEIIAEQRLGEMAQLVKPPGKFPGGADPQGAQSEGDMACHWGTSV